MNQRKLNPKAFEAFLKTNCKTSFGIRETTCPLAKWLDESLVLEDLDSFPAWANRFHGAGEERYQWSDIPPGTGRNALDILKRSVV